MAIQLAKRKERMSQFWKRPSLMALRKKPPELKTSWAWQTWIQLVKTSSKTTSSTCSISIQVITTPLNITKVILVLWDQKWQACTLTQTTMTTTMVVKQDNTASRIKTVISLFQITLLTISSMPTGQTSITKTMGCTSTIKWLQIFQLDTLPNVQTLPMKWSITKVSTR